MGKTFVSFNVIFKQAKKVGRTRRQIMEMKKKGETVPDSLVRELDRAVTLLRELEDSILYREDTLIL